MGKPDKTAVAAVLALATLLIAGPWLPRWLSFLVTVALARALVVAGVVVLMRAGLVSFGQGLYFCVGGYAAGLAGRYLGLTDAFALLALGLASGLAIGAVLGALLCRYREIFFAMFTLAFSMILYGILARSQALGSTDGFHVPSPTFLGYAPENAGTWVFALASLVAVACAWGLHRYFHAGLGYAGEAVRENEIRVEYLGVSARRVVYIKYVLAAGLAALGGTLTAFATGHVGPDMAYWTTSGEFVFIALMGGTAHVAAPYLGSLIFELVKSYAFQVSPYTWQLILGAVLLTIILFLPRGLWSLVAGRGRA
ncbi:branched-chain amino acid ABC transporter permease [Pelomicrobium sp. G1]|uniref:branched-chain amino acid ABC transporter permease n=1 Tax=unclassified Pelomicrobium TaxID=2815318 RepID=UPI000AE2BD86|nr:MAG: branched-chain amino acid ABC transporter permease [Burkholderiales bacterium]